MTIVHVHQQRIRQNIKLPIGLRKPPIIVKSKTGTTYHTTIDIKGPCKLVYSPDKPLRCGARLWIEVDPSVEVEGN